MKCAREFICGDHGGCALPSGSWRKLKSVKSSTASKIDGFRGRGSSFFDVSNVLSCAVRESWRHHYLPVFRNCFDDSIFRLDNFCRFPYAHRVWHPHTCSLPSEHVASKTPLLGAPFSVFLIRRLHFLAKSKQTGYTTSNSATYHFIYPRSVASVMSSVASLSSTTQVEHRSPK